MTQCLLPQLLLRKLKPVYWWTVSSAGTLVHVYRTPPPHKTKGTWYLFLPAFPTAGPSTLPACLTSLPEFDHDGSSTSVNHLSKLHIIKLPSGASFPNSIPTPNTWIYWKFSFNNLSFCWFCCVFWSTWKQDWSSRNSSVCAKTGLKMRFTGMSLSSRKTLIYAQFQNLMIQKSF